MFDKHPAGQPAPEMLISNSPPVEEPNPALYDRLDCEMTRSVALRSTGGAGINLHGWKRLYTSFKQASSDLCNRVSLVA